MPEIDGLYRYAGTEVRWGRDGVRLTHSGHGGRVVHAPWFDVTGARRAGSAGGFVQIEVRDRAVPRQPGGDQFAFAVSSEHDLSRLLTQFNWYARQGYPEVEVELQPGTAQNSRPRRWRDRLFGSR